MKLNEIINTPATQIGELTRFVEHRPNKFTTNNGTFLRSGLLETDPANFDPSLDQLLKPTVVFDYSASMPRNTSTGHLSYDSGYYFVHYTSAVRDWYSADLVTWNQVIAAPLGDGRQIFKVQDNWIRISSSGGQAYTTDNLDTGTWTNRAVAGSNPSTGGAAHDGTNIVVARSAGQLSISTNAGINWTNITLGSAQLNRVAYFDGVWIASTNGGFWRSTDLVDWGFFDPRGNLTGAVISGIAVNSQGTWVAWGVTTGSGGTPVTWNSNDGGLTWTMLSTGFSSAFSSVSVLDNVFYATNASSSSSGQATYFYSEDGVVWYTIQSSIRVISSKSLLTAGPMGVLFASSSASIAERSISSAGTEFISANHYMRIK